MITQNPKSIFVIALGLSLLALADDKAPAIKWAANDIQGQAIQVPQAGKVSVLAFVRADQPQSEDALNQIKATVGQAKDVGVIVILSSPQAVQEGKALAAGGNCPWPIVPDPSYAVSGRMGVHVWPTVLVIDMNGNQAAHLAGLPRSFSADLGANIDFAAGRIDKKTLESRLASHDVVADSPKQMAGRHLQVAQRLLEKGSVEQAAAEVADGLKLQPQDVQLQLMSARIALAKKDPRQALQILDAIPADSVPGWQTSLLRGKALILQEKWDMAKTVLPEAIKLNPDPAEAHYLLGQVYEHEKDYTKAAAEFRAAYEANISAVRMK